VSAEEGGLGRIVSCGGDGKINVFQLVSGLFLLASFPPVEAWLISSSFSTTQSKPTTDGEMPTHSLLSTIESAHGVSDVNHVAWCKLSPAKAAETLRRLEGGEEDEEGAGEKMETETEQEEDPRWKGGENLFASAGDDGAVKVWLVGEEGGEPTASKEETKE
jgi:cytosolic iron-sulfur protein assembly protein CIAO1